VVTATPELAAALVFGQKYAVRGIIKSPFGETVVLVPVWIVLNGETLPRLITAHPGNLR